MADDDLLNPDEIDKLLNPSGGGTPPGDTDTPSDTPDVLSSDESASASEPLSDSDLEALLPGGGGASGPDELLDQAQAGLNAAIAPEITGIEPIPQELGSPENYEFESFDQSASGNIPSIGLEALKEVDLDLRVELGKAELLIDEVLHLVKGSVVPLDKLAGDPVDVIVNDNLVARGEVLVLNGNFCVRIAEILSPEL